MEMNAEWLLHRSRHDLCLVKPEMFAGVVWSHKNSTQQKGSQIGPEIVCLFGKKKRPEAWGKEVIR